MLTFDHFELLVLGKLCLGETEFLLEGILTDNLGEADVRMGPDLISNLSLDLRLLSNTLRMFDFALVNIRDDLPLPVFEGIFHVEGSVLAHMQQL